MVNMKNGLKIDKHGTKCYYKDGFIYKEKYLNNAVFYFDQQKLLHKYNSPAVLIPNGSRAWYIHGKRHRIDGPAIEYPDGEKSWYLDGKEIDCKTNEEFLKLVKLKAWW